MAINADGKVESSIPYDVMNPEGGKTYLQFHRHYSGICYDMRCSPIVTSTKVAEQ